MTTNDIVNSVVNYIFTILQAAVDVVLIILTYLIARAFFPTYGWKAYLYLIGFAALFVFPVTGLILDIDTRIDIVAKIIFAGLIGIYDRLRNKEKN